MFAVGLLVALTVILPPPGAARNAHTVAMAPGALHEAGRPSEETV